MKLLSKRIILGFSILFFFTMCSDNKQIQLAGQLENIPDGEMIFYTRDRRTGKIVSLDSCRITNGRFSLLVSSKKYPEPIRVFLKHRETKSGILRVFSFSTNLKYRGGSMNLDHFLLEDGIKINGKVLEYTPKGFKPNLNLKFVNIDRPIVIGRQTQIAYNDTIEFGNLNSIEQIKQSVRQHPYSYYYLYDLERRVSEFSNENFLSAFNYFDENVKQSKTGQQLLAYINNRKDKRLTFSTTLVDEQGHTQPILDKTAQYNLIVLWASWCGPCRREIPELKKFYARVELKQKLQLVSVSLDENREAWLKMLRKENMPWPQLLITPSIEPYAKEIFQFDGSIPTMLLVNQQGRIVRKIVGDDKKAIELIEKIAVNEMPNATLR